MARMIHESISKSIKFASLSIEAQILFVLLIPHLNAYGKMNGDPHYIKGMVTPLLEYSTITLIQRCLEEINDKTNVKWFKSDGLYYIHAIHWDKYQRFQSDRRGENKLPEYSKSTPTVKSKYKSKYKSKNKDIYSPVRKPDIPVYFYAHSAEIIKQIIDYLNEKANTSYRANSKKTISLIKSRIADGFTVEDFKTVIDKKCQEWKNTDMEKFLRPETLFGNKFEGYLNQKIITKKQAEEEAYANDPYATPIPEEFL